MKVFFTYGSRVSSRQRLSPQLKRLYKIKAEETRLKKSRLSWIEQLHPYGRNAVNW